MNATLRVGEVKFSTNVGYEQKMAAKRNEKKRQSNAIAENFPDESLDLAKVRAPMQETFLEKESAAISFAPMAMPAADLAKNGNWAHIKTKGRERAQENNAPNKSLRSFAIIRNDLTVSVAMLDTIVP